MALEAYVGVSAALFALGLICIISRRNILYVLFGVEMILNAADHRIGLENGKNLKPEGAAVTAE